MEKQFKVNDWVFCEFELQQIMGMEEDRVTEVSTGQFRLSGQNLTDRCFPLSLHVKNAADTAKYWWNEFNKLNVNGLNYPDLNRKLISIWVDICEESDKTKVASLYKKIDEFGRSILKRVRDLKYEEVDGVNLFRR